LHQGTGFSKKNYIIWGRIKKTHKSMCLYKLFNVMKKQLKVGVQGMQFYAYHGFYETENIIGNDYLIDVETIIEFPNNIIADELTNTLNYETIYNTTKIVMSKSVKLLETIGETIIDELISNHPEIQQIVVRIKKLNPPFGGQVHASFVEIKYGCSLSDEI